MKPAGWVGQGGGLQRREIGKYLGEDFVVGIGVPRWGDNY